jgi:hypothetical protein
MDHHVNVKRVIMNKSWGVDGTGSLSQFSTGIADMYGKRPYVLAQFLYWLQMAGSNVAKSEIMRRIIMNNVMQYCTSLRISILLRILTRFLASILFLTGIKERYSYVFSLRILQELSEDISPYKCTILVRIFLLEFS